MPVVGVLPPVKPREPRRAMPWTRWTVRAGDAAKLWCESEQLGRFSPQLYAQRPERLAAVETFRDRLSGRRRAVLATGGRSLGELVSGVLIWRRTELLAARLILDGTAAQASGDAAVIVVEVPDRFRAELPVGWVLLSDSDGPAVIDTVAVLVRDGMPVGDAVLAARALA